MRLLPALMFAIAAMSSRVSAQLVDNGKNWGLTLGVDLMTGSYDPSHDTHRGDQPYAYASRAYGARLNAGVVFLKHFLLGGDAGTALFNADRTFTPVGGGYTTHTTNSLVSSLYVGIVTTPMGRTPRVGRKVWVGALLGKAKWGGERRFVDCATCDGINPLPMRSGPYVEPFVVVGGGDRDGGGGFRLAYRRYVASWATVRSEVSLGLFFDFLKL